MELLLLGFIAWMVMPPWRIEFRRPTETRQEPRPEPPPPELIFVKVKDGHNEPLQAKRLSDIKMVEGEKIDAYNKDGTLYGSCGVVSKPTLGGHMEYGRRKKRIPKDQKFKDAVRVYDWNPTWDPKKIEFGRKKIREGL